MTREIEALVVRGAEGMALYIDGKRVAGPKPWGGGSTIYTFKADRDAILTALSAGEGAFSAISDEVNRATTKFPTWPTDPLHALAVLGEEFGELTKEALQLVYEPHKTSRDKVREEAIQTAAMAVRFLMSLDSYAYVRSAQHEQSALATPAPQEETNNGHDSGVVLGGADRVCSRRDRRGVVAVDHREGNCTSSLVTDPAPPARDGAALIAAERQRQVTACGWTPGHDDQHRHRDLSSVAAQLALGLPDAWGLHAKHDNATNDIRRLTIAGALIAAEIDRLQRVAPASAPEGFKVGDRVTLPGGGDGIGTVVAVSPGSVVVRWSASGPTFHYAPGQLRRESAPEGDGA